MTELPDLKQLTGEAKDALIEMKGRLLWAIAARRRWNSLVASSWYQYQHQYQY